MTATSAEKPHIALILADNLGWGELGCYGDGVCSKGKLESPMLVHRAKELAQGIDPKEETNILVKNTWALGPIQNMVEEFRQTLKEHPPIPPGAPDPYLPP